MFSNVALASVGSGNLAEYFDREWAGVPAWLRGWCVRTEVRARRG